MGLKLRLQLVCFMLLYSPQSVDPDRHLLTVAGGEGQGATMIYLVMEACKSRLLSCEQLLIPTAGNMYNLHCSIL
jgi:hypothetical protein